MGQRRLYMDSPVVQGGTLAMAPRNHQFWVSFEQDRADILARELLDADHLMLGVGLLSL